MINKTTTFLKSLGSKSIIILIALSFAVWGIGDIFISNKNPIIAKVGNKSIKLNEFNLEYFSVIDRIKQSAEEPITDDFLKAMGIHQTVLNNLINQKYLNILSEDLGIKVEDKYIKKSILNNPIFKDQLGVFNKDYFNFYLNRNNLSENELINISKNVISNDVVISTVNSQSYIPSYFTNNILKKRDLARKAEVYIFDGSGIIIKDKISEDLIRKKYEQIKDSLLTPENRSIDIVAIKFNQFDSVSISEEQLKETYNLNKDLYKKIQKKEVYQPIFKTENEANEFIQSFNKSNNFFKELNRYNINKEDIYLGNMEEDQFEGKESEYFRNLNTKNISQPIKSSFGWKLIYINSTLNEKTKSFAEVKAEIEKDLRTEIKNEKVYNKANEFYEVFLKNKNFNSTIEKLNLNTREVKNISLLNLKDKQKNINIDLKENELAKILFNLTENDISDTIEDKTGIYFIHLKKINKSKVKSFSQAREEVLNIVYEEKRVEKTKQDAETFNQELASLNNPKNYNKSKIFRYFKTDWITEDTRLNKNLEQTIKNVIFSTKLNSFSNIERADNFKFFIVRPTIQSNKIIQEKELSNVDKVNQNLAFSINEDIMQAFLTDLKRKHKNEINKNFLNSF